jgi:hypothetical protein
MRRVGDEAGQSAVELVALLPVLAIAGLAVLQLLAAGAAREYAGHAAEAGAVALFQDRDPAQAAREALPGWSRRRVRVSVAGRAVRVRVRPPALLPGVTRWLEASGAAHAGGG